MLFRSCNSPKLFGHERHEGMQKLEDLFTHKGGCRAGLDLVRPVVALQDGLCQFEIPIAKNIPDKFVDGVGRIVETVGFNCLRHLGGYFGCFANDPAIERENCLTRIESRVMRASSIIQSRETYCKSFSSTNV